MAAIAVVVGVIVNAVGEILLAKRASHQHQGGLWEFPGGKLESGEPALAGLWRELNEELGIELTQSQPLIQIQHQYPDKSVLLDVYIVSQFNGEPQGREGQPLVWVKPENLAHYPLPAANRPIMQALQLPAAITISGDAATPEEWLQRLERSIASGSKMILARALNTAQMVWPWQQILPQAHSLCQRQNARLLAHSNLLNENHLPLELMTECCHGLHLGSFVAAQWRQVLPEGFLLGMSCHTAQELTHAAKLRCDYALLSSVLPTQSHPGAQVLGWSEFAKLCLPATLPVYALGGMNSTHDFLARTLGGQGVAGIRGFWSQAQLG